MSDLTNPPAAPQMASIPTATAHRADIDGLRAIAVLAILFFHAEFRWMPGGFRGVDMFFVVSGYLITGILLREHAAGSFSLLGFYERRVRRIIPALFAMLLAVTVAAYVVLMPIDLRVFGQNLVAIVLFASNVLFWRRGGGTDFYFEPSAHLNPVLHTWSLGVEEQFYLLFPLILWLVWRVGRRHVLATVWVIALASFLYSSLIDGEWGLGLPPLREANFYLLPSRAWQLMVGSVVAALVHRRPVNREGWWPVAAVSIGFALVAYSLLTYNTTDYRFPSVFALPATVGTAWLLMYGPLGWVGRLLGWRPLVVVGLISYSAYLWHQPIFAFGHYLALDAALSGPTAVALCVVSLGGAWLSWRFIESPFRDRRWLSRRTLFGSAAFAAVVLVGVGLSLGLSRRVPTVGRLVGSTGLLETLTTSALPGTAMRDCAPGAPESPGCLLAPSLDTPARFLVIGDSHAGALLPAFRRVSELTGQQGRLITLRLCPPLLDVYAAEEHGCLALQRSALDYATRAHVTDVFLVARWAGYTDGDYRGSFDGFLSQPSWTLPRSRLGARAALVDGLRRSVDAYTAIGATVHIVAQVPLQQHRPIGIYLQSLLRADPDFVRRMSVGQEQHRRLQGYVSSVFAEYRERPQVTILDLQDALCADGVCLVGTPEQSYYWDDNHLSTAGSLHIAGALARASGLPLPAGAR